MVPAMRPGLAPAGAFDLTCVGRIPTNRENGPGRGIFMQRAVPVSFLLAMTGRFGYACREGGSGLPDFHEVSLDRC